MADPNLEKLERQYKQAKARQKLGAPHHLSFAELLPPLPVLVGCLSDLASLCPSLLPVSFLILAPCS